MSGRPLRVLLLGGTGEGARLAQRLAGTRGVAVVSSLAGRTSRPLLPAGEVRVGGFGGPEGLVAYLTGEGVGAVVDATHPFAARMTASAAAACRRLGLPYLIVHRPAWAPVAGDRWVEVDSVAAAAGAVEGRGRRVFLTVGRQELAAFAACTRSWFLIRAIDAPVVPLPPDHELLLDRGPFTLQSELALLRRHGIDVLVSKNSGGEATYPKIVAARALGLPVVIVRRPPLPEDAPVVGGVEDAVAWVRRLAQGGRGGPDDPHGAGPAGPAG